MFVIREKLRVYKEKKIESEIIFFPETYNNNNKWWKLFLLLIWGFFYYSFGSACKILKGLNYNGSLIDIQF